MSDKRHGVGNGLWVVGFLFSGNLRRVVLIEKKRPEWQKGLLNGVGGKIELGETPRDAMRREFREETGVDIEEWREFCELRFKLGTVYFFAAVYNADIKSVTDEKVDWYHTWEIPNLPTIPNSRWLVPMAIDKDAVYAVVEEPL